MIRIPITRTLSLTFFPGIRPLTLTKPAAGVEVRRPPEQPRQLRPSGGARGGAHDRGLARPCNRQVADVRPRVLGIAAEGTLAPGAPPFRAVVIGDGDFASNSFLPYMANSDLLVAAVRWLAREERGTAVRTRIPVPPMILLTGAQSRMALHLHRRPLAADGDRDRRRGLVAAAMSAVRCGASPCRCLPCWRSPISLPWW